MTEEADIVIEPALSQANERPYRLEDQAGFLLRQASQRHTAIFAKSMIADLTPTQWAALAKLAQLGPCSQNSLGRQTAMDAATIKGVIDRLTARKLTEARADPGDNRRLTIALTAEGEKLAADAVARAHGITDATLAPLAPDEQREFLRLLAKLR